ncbi:MAG: ABC transporter permease [Clostridiales bacterium]|jgi:spermidine/putrescine transport system permease protein|nr:ABC transporter permease [Clostridiales bacterium]
MVNGAKSNGAEISGIKARVSGVNNGESKPKTTVAETRADGVKIGGNDAVTGGSKNAANKKKINKKKADAGFYARRKIGYYVGKSYVFLILGLIYIPILMIIVYSFSSGRGFSNFSFSFANINELFTGGSTESRRMLRALENTLLVGLASSVLATFLGTLGAVGVNSMRKKPREFMLNISNVPIFNADIIIALSLMMLFTALNIQRSAATVILSHAAVISPYVLLNVLPRLKQMNMSVYEAALDLGSPPLSALVKIIVPEILPGMVSGFVLAFTLSIDDFVVTDYTRSNSFETLSTYIYSQAAGKEGLSGALKPLSALIFLTVLAALLVFNLRKNSKLKRAENK